MSNVELLTLLEHLSSPTVCEKNNTIGVQCGAPYPSGAHYFTHVCNTSNTIVAQCGAAYHSGAL